jgi:hypothetical protein
VTTNRTPDKKTPPDAHLGARIAATWRWRWALFKLDEAAAREEFIRAGDPPSV